MKKGQIFLPLVTIGLLVVMSVFIFLKYTHLKESEESFSIGDSQARIIDNYFESEKIYFYYEKFLEYKEYKSVNEFGNSGGIKESCGRRWKFNSECEPEFRNQFKKVLSKNLDKKYKELNIDERINIHFTDFSFPSGSEMVRIDYKRSIIIKRMPLINFEELEELKGNIRNCIQNKEINKCSPESNIGSIYKFKKEIAEILNKNMEKEKISLNFEVDISNSGLVTDIFS